MVNRGKQKGYQLEHEVSRGLELDSTMFWKIPDAKTLGVPIPNKVPADFILNCPTGLVLLECKATAQKGRIPKRNFKPHQIDIARALGERYFFLIDFYAGRNHDIFLIRGDAMAMLYDMATASVSRDDIENLAKKLNRLTGRHDYEKSQAHIRGICDGIHHYD